MEKVGRLQLKWGHGEAVISLAHRQLALNFHNRRGSELSSGIDSKGSFSSFSTPSLSKDAASRKIPICTPFPFLSGQRFQKGVRIWAFFGASARTDNTASLAPLQC